MVALKWYWQWLVFAVLALVLYYPVIGNTFLSDDHLVLLKVGVEEELNVDGFFRPLSDITIWLTYKLAGLHPLPYYLSQVLLHALNAVMLVQYARKMWNAHAAAALFAGLLFLCYPFHNEGIAWILGRGALMAGTFAIAAMLTVVSDFTPAKKISVICICYFLGLAAYETIIVLPLMVAAQLLLMRAPQKLLIRMVLALLITFLLHAWLRITVSGAFLGGYGGGFFQEIGMNKLQAMFKSTGRIILPPSDNSQALVIGFTLSVLIMAGILFIALRKSKQPAKRLLYTQLACLAIAMLVPMWLGVSTRTSESDRFLYLPSFFLCTLLAFTLWQVFNREKVRIIIAALLLFIQVALLQENNANWQRASDSVRRIMEEVKQFSGAGRLQIINLPGETDGAYIFRVGFWEAVRLYGYDSSGIRVINRLTRDEELTLPPVIVPYTEASISLIRPSVFILKAPFTGDTASLTEMLRGRQLGAWMDSMLTVERGWNFADAATVLQLQQFIRKQRMQVEAVQVCRPLPGDRLLYWDRRQWVRFPF